MAGHNKKSARYRDITFNLKFNFNRNVICGYCDGWGDTIEVINPKRPETYDEGLELIPCLECSTTGILPIPLSEIL